MQENPDQPPPIPDGQIIQTTAEQCSLQGGSVGGQHETPEEEVDPGGN